MILPYATTKAKLIIIRIGIVEFVPKENVEESPEYSIVDEFPDLNIYEKIQILIYENEYIKKENISCYSPKSFTKTLPKSIPKSKSIPIPIPKSKKNY